MRRRILLSVLFLVCVFFLMARSSQADTFSGEIWKPAGDLYNFGTHDLTNGFFTTLGTSDAQFTVDNINFDTLLFGSSATYTQFLGAPGNVNNLVWANGASATFGAQTIQTDGTHASFFQISGTAFFPANFTIRRDDGFVLYVDGALVIDASSPVAPTDTPVNLGLTPGVYSFTLNYAAWNSFPEVLTAPDITSVPEPGILILLCISVMSLAGLRKWWKE